MMKNSNTISDFMLKGFSFTNWSFSAICAVLMLCLIPASSQCVKIEELQEIVIENQENDSINLSELSKDNKKLGLADEVHLFLSLTADTPENLARDQENDRRGAR